MNQLTMAQLLKLYEIIERHEDNFEVQHAGEWDYKLSSCKAKIAWEIAARIKQEVR